MFSVSSLFKLKPSIITKQEVLIEDLIFERDCYLSYLINSQTAFAAKTLEKSKSS